MQKPVLIEQSILSHVSLASMAKALAAIGVPARNIWGAEDEKEVRQLVDMIKADQLNPADILVTLTQRATTTELYAPNKFAAVKKLSQEITVKQDAITYAVKDKLTTLRCTGGIIDWSGDARAGTRVNVSRALLAKEIACDVQVVKGQPSVVPRQETGTFKGEYNQVQPLRAVEVTKRATFNKLTDSKGYALADRMYENLKSYDADDVKWVADRLHSADPDLIRTGKDLEGHPTTKYDDISYKIQNQEGELVVKKGKYRSVSGCVRHAKNPLGGAQMFHLIQHFDKHVGGKKFGAGKMVNDFFYGVPIDSIYMKGLKVLSIVKNLRDDKTPIAIHTGDKLLAAFIRANTGRSVGYCGELLDNEVDLKKKQEDGDLWQFDPTTTPQNCIIIYPKAITFHTGTDYSKTYAGSKIVLETILAGRPANSIMMAHVYALSDWLGTDDRRSPKIGTFDVSIMLNHSLATKHVVICKGVNMFKQSWTGSEANLTLKNFFANYPSYRYHRVPFVRILRGLSLPGFESDPPKSEGIDQPVAAKKVPPVRRLLRFPFESMTFSFVDEKDIMGDDLETIDPTFLSGTTLAKWHDEWTDLVKGLDEEDGDEDDDKIDSSPPPVVKKAAPPPPKKQVPVISDKSITKEDDKKPVTVKGKKKVQWKPKGKAIEKVDEEEKVESEAVSLD